MTRLRDGIALLHYSCPPTVGGVEEVLRQQALLLHRHGHPVRVLAGQGSDLGAGIDLTIDPLLGSRFGPAVAAQEAGDEAALAALTQRCLDLLRSCLADTATLLAHNVLSMPFNLPLTRALRALAAEAAAAPGQGRLQVVGWNHDSPYFNVDHERRLDRFPWTVLRDPHPSIRWVTISPARQVEFTALYGSAVTPDVVPNGIDPYRFLKIEPRTAALADEEGLLEADLVLVQPSRLHPRKNVELSIRVVHALRRRGCDARLLVSGAHDPHDPAAAGYARRLRTLAEEQGVGDAVVIVADYRFRDGTRMQASEVVIRDLCQVADVLFLPSRSEGFGLPLLEAGLIRLPVACADIPPLRGMGGEDVYRFALDDPPDDIAQGVVAHLEALPTHRWYRRVLATYTWEHVYRDALGPLLADPAPPLHP